MESEVENDQLRDSLEKYVNSHGYGFQYAVVATATRLAAEGDTHWRLPVTEFPVVGGRGTRIDIIFKHHCNEAYLVCECKRANPALSNWCFLRAPHVRDVGSACWVYGEALRFEAGSGPGSVVQVLAKGQETYQIALQLRTDSKGDPTGKGHEEIEDAATQVLRGFNGLATYFVKSGTLVKGSRPIFLLPVIFTTARLFTSDVNLDTADLQSGNIDLSSAKLIAKDWVVYHYSQSPELRHSLSVTPAIQDGDPLTRDLYTQFVRPIFIVSARGISAFLQARLWDRV